MILDFILNPKRIIREVAEGTVPVIAGILVEDKIKRVLGPVDEEFQFAIANFYYPGQNIDEQLRFSGVVVIQGSFKIDRDRLGIGHCHTASFGGTAGLITYRQRHIVGATRITSHEGRDSRIRAHQCGIITAIALQAPIMRIGEPAQAAIEINHTAGIRLQGNRLEYRLGKRKCGISRETHTGQQ